MIDLQLRPARSTAGPFFLLLATLALAACSSDDGAAPAPTPTLVGAGDPTATPVPSPTPATAGLRISLTNPTAGEVVATLSGQIREATAGNGGHAAYDAQVSIGSNGIGTTTLSGLRPGIWLHAISVPATGQQQARRGLLVSDPSGAATVDWTAYASVLMVTDGSDSGDGTCDTTCTLRDAVTAANAAPSPALVLFDHAALGTPAEVALIDERLVVSGTGMAIDGTGADGNPSPLAVFGDRSYATLITVTATGTPVTPPPSDSCPCEDEYGGELFVTAAAARLTGLHIRRQQPAQADVCCGDQDLIELGTGAAGTRIETCLLDGGGRAITDSVTPMGMTGQATGKDCVEPKNTGSTSSNPVTVSNSELRFCLDRGVKVENDLALLTDNWIHNNLRCGLFAVVASGTIQAERNLIEENGMNCPSGAPPSCDDQVVTRPDAPQVAAQGATTTLILQDNIVRHGPLTGLYMEDGSVGLLEGELACGMGDDGILSEKGSGTASDVVVRGSAAALNAGAGVKLEGSIGIDLGDAALGYNAFAGNPDNKQVLNLLSPAELVATHGNQWQSCYAADAPEADSCDVDAISSDDTNNSSDATVVDVADPLPQQGSGDVTLLSVWPSATTAGGRVTLHGTGFDAVTGYVEADGDCTALGTSNSCAPLQGTCVEFRSGEEWLEAADVLAVTPTSITVLAPFTCATTSAVRVSRAVLGGTPVTSDPLPFCVGNALSGPEVTAGAAGR